MAQSLIRKKPKKKKRDQKPKILVKPLKNLSCLAYENLPKDNKKNQKIIRDLIENEIKTFIEQKNNSENLKKVWKEISFEDQDLTEYFDTLCNEEAHPIESLPQWASEFIYWSSRACDPSLSHSMAIEKSTTLARALLKTAYTRGLPFTDASILAQNKVAVSLGERFADLTASQVMAPELYGLPREARLNKVKASFSYFCQDIQNGVTLSNELSQILRKPADTILNRNEIDQWYKILDPLDRQDAHPEAWVRARILFTRSMQKALSCEKDFEMPDCSID